MIIKKLEAHNFKTFSKLSLDLHKFNILIGANASGKSNFIEIFKFIRDISRFGLDNAVSMQGGIEYIKNIKSDIGEEITINLLMESNEPNFFIRTDEKSRIALNPSKLDYTFSLKPKEKPEDFEISRENLIINYEGIALEGHGDIDRTQIDDIFKSINEIYESKTDQIKQITLTIENIEGKPNKKELTPSDLDISFDKLIPAYFLEENKTDRRLLISLPIIPFRLLRMLTSISAYDFDPKLSKKSAQITGKTVLEEDASNLAIVLKRIKEDPKKIKKLSNIMRDILPFISDLRVEKSADRSLFFNISEIYSKDNYFPSSLLSDGTINIIALIVALFFENKPFAIYEEPERNIHPHLISRVVNMLKDASRNNQIIITTHNPQIVKFADIEDLLLISRNNEGYSSISRPSENAEVKEFLEDELGIEDLYVDNLLE